MTADMHFVTSSLKSLVDVQCHHCIARAPCAVGGKETVFGYVRIAVNLQSWEDKGLSNCGLRRASNSFRLRSQCY